MSLSELTDQKSENPHIAVVRSPKAKGEIKMPRNRPYRRRRTVRARRPTYTRGRRRMVRRRGGKRLRIGFRM